MDNTCQLWAEFKLVSIYTSSLLTKICTNYFWCLDWVLMQRSPILCCPEPEIRTNCTNDKYLRKLENKYGQIRKYPRKRPNIEKPQSSWFEMKKLTNMLDLFYEKIFWQSRWSTVNILLSKKSGCSDKMDSLMLWGGCRNWKSPGLQSNLFLRQRQACTSHCNLDF